MSTPALTPAESLTVTSESAPVWQNLTPDPRTPNEGCGGLNFRAHRPLTSSPRLLSRVPRPPPCGRLEIQRDSPAPLRLLPALLREVPSQAFALPSRAFEETKFLALPILVSVSIQTPDLHRLPLLQLRLARSALHKHTPHTHPLPKSRTSRL